MRIALSGTHRTGKSSLAAELGARLRGYSVVDEPYRLMEEDGYEFAHPPTVEDFEAQLERSLEELDQAGDNVVFDRCPLDFLAYLAAHDDSASVDFGDLADRVRDAIGTLDLVVFVPVEHPDRISVAEAADEGESREVVDEKVREVVVDDVYGFGLEVVGVCGDLEQRAQMVLDYLREIAG